MCAEADEREQSTSCRLPLFCVIMGRDLQSQFLFSTHDQTLHTNSSERNCYLNCDVGDLVLAVRFSSRPLRASVVLLDINVRQSLSRGAYHMDMISMLQLLLSLIIYAFPTAFFFLALAHRPFFLKGQKARRIATSALQKRLQYLLTQS